MPIFIDIGTLAAGFVCNGCHNRGNGGLHRFVQLPVVNADTVFTVRRDNPVRRVQAAVKEAVYLLDAAFVRSLFFHHLEKACQIERNNGNNGACTGYQPLVDRHKCLPLYGCKFGVQCMGGRFQMLLRLADGALAVQCLRRFWPDVRIRNRDTSLRKQPCVVEFFYPALPILTAHHLYGSGSFFLARRIRSDFCQRTGKRVEGFAGKGFSKGFERRAVGNAGVGVGTHGACYAVDN